MHSHSIPKPFQIQYAKDELTISSQKKIAISLQFFFFNLQAGPHTRKPWIHPTLLPLIHWVPSILPPQGIQLLPFLHAICHKTAKEICLNANRIEHFSHHKQLLVSPRHTGAHSLPSAWKNLVVHQTCCSIQGSAATTHRAPTAHVWPAACEWLFRFSSNSLCTCRSLSSSTATIFFTLSFCFSSSLSTFL